MRWLFFISFCWIPLLAALPPLQGDERILHLECGTGEETAYLSQLVPDGFVLGVDRSPDAIAFAHATYDPDLFLNLDFKAAPIGDLDLRFDWILVPYSVSPEDIDPLRKLLADEGNLWYNEKAF